MDRPMADQSLAERPLGDQPPTGRPPADQPLLGESLPDPAVRVAAAQEIASDLLVIPNHRVALVPNIGIIAGTQAVLVVETGIGPANAEEVLAFAAEVAKGRRLYLTTTHFHPEHAFGAQVFTGEATYLINRAQADDLNAKGSGYLEMFRAFGGSIAERLDGVRLPIPDEIYDEAYDLDLGGRTVRLRPTGRGHTKGDQVVEVPDAGVLFTGDLAETGQFAIFPWFPPARHGCLRRALAGGARPAGRRRTPGGGAGPRRPRRRGGARRRTRLPG